MPEKTVFDGEFESISKLLASNLPEPKTRTKLIFNWLPEISKISALTYQSEVKKHLQHNLHDIVYEKGKIDTISKTVWILWKDQPERIWRLLHRWSRQDSDVKAAGYKILEHGIDHGHITPDDAFDRLWEWLLSDEAESQDAAGALLPALPGDYLFETSGRWVKLSKDERKTKLSDMLTRLFTIDAKRTLRILTHWAEKHPGAFDRVIEKTLPSVPILDNQAPEYYRSLDMQLRLFKQKFDKQSRLWLIADKLCKSARKLRSKAINWQKKTGHAAQFSKSGDPDLSKKSIRRRKT